MNARSSHNTQISAGWKAVVAVALLFLHVGVFAMACAQDNQGQSKAAQTAVLGTADDQTDIRFEAIDVIVDSGNEALGAYQFELDSVSDGVEIVGIEGGEHAAYADPPYYDPQAMNGNRVILAAFSTDAKLPTGRSRVARIHVQLEGAAPKSYRFKLTATANDQGEDISAEVEIAKTKA